jgi:hypothetical protein
MNLIAKLLLNSLYGKFGMKVEMNRIDMFDIDNKKDKKNLSDLIDLYTESIKDIIQIDNTFVIIRDSLPSLRYDEGEDLYHGIDVNIAIASAVTAYARIYMSQFKNNNNFNLYYSDTDSIVIDKELPKDHISKELGFLKLEHKIKRGVFLAPKVYALETEDGKSIVKVKGLSDEIQDQIDIDVIKRLLFKDSSMEFSQEKWFKKIIEGTISIREVIYTLKVTSNKRQNIYNEYQILSETKPLYYENIISK